MDEFLKMLLEKAVKEGKVHVVQVGDEPKKNTETDSLVEAKKEAAELAKLNRILYEAHVCEGFTSEEALALTVATITCK